MTSNCLIDQCYSFELRGPYCALTRVDGDNIQVVRRTTNWSDIVGDRPVIDNRNGNLADLFPRPRAVLDRVINSIADSAAETPKVSNGPRF